MKTYPLELRRYSDTITRLDATRLLLAFKQPHTFDDLLPILRRLGLVLEEGGENANGPYPREFVNHTDHRFWIRTLTGDAVDQQLYDSIEKLFGEQLDWIGPVYRMADTSGLAGLFCPLPNVLLIKTKKSDPVAISRIEDEFHLRSDLEKFKHLIGYHYFVIDKFKDSSSYQLQRQILEKVPHLIEDVAFENMPILVPFSMIPNDELYGFQWNMARIRVGGDIQNPGAVTGWDIRRGSSNIIIAILDSGCDLAHPDLWFSGDGVNGTLFGTGAYNPSALAPGFQIAHGTFCAGVAAAPVNNLKGMSGVAGGCLIWPFAFVNFTEVELIYGIDYATHYGARVINMSFNSTIWNPAIINPYIDFAYNRNIIMCASTGNGNGLLVYPATHPRVIACGASDLNDDRAVFRRDSSGNPILASNFGPGISVMAPGISIVTTNISGGSPGSNSGDYITGFWGTSAATPHVSGLAALLLSEDSTLTSEEVRDIIEQTADKVGQVPYSPDPFGNPNKSWNKYFGYGRINVLRALQAVRARRERQSGSGLNYAPVSAAQERAEANPLLHFERLKRGLIEHEAVLDRLDKKRIQLDTQTTLHRTLLRLGRDVGILNLINEMYESPGLIEELRKDSGSVLRLREIILPEGVSVSVVDEPQRAVRLNFSVNGNKFFAQWSPELGFFSASENEYEHTAIGGVV